ncbi:BTAD domain-containing putative transcriptional regulator [Actinoplanes sp. NPDC026619]|uniref:BTAD domain-containing putative transcriptional regulator n=1 Tax=Actinoplanes sp. NPDC026619 TaxID=3155798 RepID=UPI0033ED8990
MSTPLRFEILGEVRVWRDGVALSLGPAKQQAVLAVLLLQAGRPVPTHQIVDAVWGDEPPENGANVVQKYVAGLRRALEPDRAPRTPGELLALTGSGYVLRAEGGVDADEFQAALARAEAEQAAGRLTEAAMTLRGALALWRGEALAGLTGPVFEAARARLADARATAWERWAETGIVQGRAATILPELGRLIEEFPMREGLRVQRMLALHQVGRQAEALAAYRDAREFFLDEVGAEPGDRMQAAHLMILRNDVPVSPAMPPPPAPAPVTPPMPGPGLMPISVPAAPPIYFPPGRGGSVALEIIGALAASLFTCGSLAWVYFLYVGIRRRQAAALAAAAFYFLLFSVGFIFFFVIDPYGSVDSEELTTQDNIGIFYFGGVMVVAAAHGLFLAARSDGHRLRERARQFAMFNPDRAREIGVGRPDVPLRLIQDGGLIDLNQLGAQELARVTKLPAPQCAEIERDRQLRGPFYRPEDLTIRGLVDARAVRKLADRLICLPPGPAPAPAAWPPRWSAGAG